MLSLGLVEETVTNLPTTEDTANSDITKEDVESPFEIINKVYV